MSIALDNSIVGGSLIGNQPLDLAESPTWRSLRE